MRNPAEEEFFSNFISRKRILIADTSAASGMSMVRTMLSLGAPQSNIALVETYAIANRVIQEIKPQVIISEYDLGPHCGLDLFQTQREQHPESKESLFILVTSNTSQSAVAQAAEEDVDGYIVKPYTIDVFRQTLLRVAFSKSYPSPYSKALEEGKRLLEEKKIDEAIALFEKALTMSPKPSLACYYRGHSQFLRQELEPAEQSFNKGLTYNKIHYKCMVGLSEVYMAKKDFEATYELTKKIFRYFPANTKRLTTVLRLAIATENFGDIEKYYQVFCDLETKDETLTRYVTAALVVCGKYYLQEKIPSRAAALFEKAAQTGAGRGSVLREIVANLAEYGMINESKAYLERFTEPMQKEIDFAVARFFVQETIIPSSKVLEEGKAYLGKGLNEPQVYRVLIKHASLLKRKAELDGYLAQAKAAYPDLALDFDEVAQGAA